jgi:hypothetical protein
MMSKSKKPSPAQLSLLRVLVRQYKVIYADKILGGCYLSYRNDCSRECPIGNRTIEALMRLDLLRLDTETEFTVFIVPTDQGTALIDATFPKGKTVIKWA